MNVSLPVIKALCRRDLKLYFSNPNGYVFITLFIFLSAAAAFWQERFFLNNLANLDQLNALFPYLLLFFVPAITMGVWADERRQGTDELLLTLPATDLEIALGKYLSTLGIYVAALVLSLSHLIVLFWLGSPDLGLMVANYFGYFLIGAAFISVGMLASLMSPNATVAFIAGAIFCSAFVYVGSIFGVLGEGVERTMSSLAVFDYFDDFARGVVSLSGLAYFLSIVAAMLYLNVVLLGRRHWPREADGYRMWVHMTVRAVAMIVALIAFNVILARVSIRLDFTAEQLHSLSKETKQLFKEIDRERPVFIQAFLSKDVPKSLIQTKANLFGFLKEIDAAAGDRVQVVVHDTEPYSQEALDAREKFGIAPVEIPGVGARGQVDQVFMGLAFTCGAEEDVIPFFDRGLPVEYELARSIRVVAKTDRKKVGVVNTQLQMFGGFDFNTMASKPGWSVVEELRKQYEVVQIAPADSIAEDLDGLLVALPSSLSQQEMDNVQTYIEAGNPALLLLDPLPIVDIGLSPSEKSGANRNPFNRSQGPPPEPKGNITAFLSALGIRWSPTQIVWDAYNPHPELASLPPEIVFIGTGNENPQSFNRANATTSGLQEIVLLYPGAVAAAPGTPYAFEPLVRTSQVSGGIDYNNYVQRSFFGIQLVGRNLPHYPSNQDYVIAAHVQNTNATADTTGSKPNVNVIVMADIDFMSEQFFDIRRRGIANLDFDNISLFLNCMDMLVGDDSFIALRDRRVKHRTLETVESKTREFMERRAQEEQQADRDAQQALAQAQQRLQAKVSELGERADLDEQTKQIMSRNLQEAENRRLEAVRATIESERDAKVQHSRETMQAQIRRIQGNIKTLAGLLPPIPVFAMGIGIFLRRRRREREGAAAVRRLKG